MKVATVKEIKEIDQAAIKDYGVPGVVLMENAGSEVTRQIAAVIGDLTGRTVAIFAGKGNNGGDGFVVARHLFNQGCRVHVVLFCEKESVTGDAWINLDIVERMGIDLLVVQQRRDWDKVKVVTAVADCIVDALLGTGFVGELSPVMQEAIQVINDSGKMVVAVDIPSGVSADTGQINETAVIAQYTVTFGLPKPGLLFYPGAAFAGEVAVSDIGLPMMLMEDVRIRQNLITEELVRSLVPIRQPYAHKGQAGKVAVIAGSPEFTGAAALTVTGALRSGAGLVSLGVAASLQAVMAVKLTEAITRGFLDDEKGIGTGVLGMDAAAGVLELAAWGDVLAVGPGLGRQEITGNLVRYVLQHCAKPVVLDADGLYAMVGHTEVLSQLPSLVILTPHPGELALLLGVSAEQVNQDRMGIASDAAQRWGQIVVLKGARTVVAFPDGEIYINPTGNAGMASGGSGDVLTGVIASLLAQGLTSHEAALLGVYVHGLAGDLAAEGNETGFLASDLAALLPKAMQMLRVI